MPIRLRLSRIICGASVVLASLSLGIYVVTIICDVFARAVFARPIVLISDLGELLIPLALGMVFPVATTQGALLKLTFLGKALGGQANWWLSQGARVVTGLIMACIAILALFYAQGLQETGRLTVQYGIPIYPVWYIIASALAVSVVGVFIAPLGESSATIVD